MRYLRYALLTATICAMVALIFVGKAQGYRWDSSEFLAFLIFGAALFGNFLYLLAAPIPASSQVGRIVRFWMNAKENELKQRATQAGSPRSE
jgi:uncharacterized membrane protein